MNLIRLAILVIVIVMSQLKAYSQISPGDLTNAHAFLEGVANCTKCHTVGQKVTNEKCLDCHKAINRLIVAKRGYHASVEVTGKDCFTCHNDHHGRNFKILKFDKSTFKHSITGFELKGAHAREDCNACNCKSCHKPSFIKDTEIKKKTSTYLGLDQQCLTCHDDFHKGKMSPKCNTCHGFETFKNATGFDHNTTNFPLRGKHKNVQCDKCHKSEIVDGKAVQKFAGTEFSNCTSCHKDAHQNKFGQNCKECHSEESFHAVKGISNFNHDKTNFHLEGKHRTVECKSCHKSSLTAAIKYANCTDCHSDYHNREFVINGQVRDCKECHDNNGFTATSFTIEKHNLLKFQLSGAHLATPCIACHKKQEKWTFRKIGTVCVDCHKDQHKGFIEQKYYPGENCTQCHVVNDWKTVKFDHAITNFKLQGAHVNQTCEACHYAKDKTGTKEQKFSGLSIDCSGCHANTHAGQFDINGKTDCTRCHGFDDWKKSLFDHNSSRFKLEGAHTKLTCDKCHKEEANSNGKFILYKNNKILCSNCHL